MNASVHSWQKEKQQYTTGTQEDTNITGYMFTTTLFTTTLILTKGSTMSPCEAWKRWTNSQIHGARLRN